MYFDSPNGSTFEWLLVPLKPINEDDINSAMNKLVIYEPPQDGCDYGFGIDTGTGIGEDRTVLSLARTGREDIPDHQAAEFFSESITTAELAPFAACIAALYAPYIPTYRQPKFCIEQVRKYGDHPQVQLKKMGFYRHHRMTRYDGKKIEERHGNKDGWFTQTWSRPYLTGAFVDAVNNGWYKPNSPYLIAELETWEQKYTTEGKTRIEHQTGKHDDCIFGAALSYITQHHLDVMIERSKRKYDRPKSSLPEIDFSPYNPSEFRVSTMRDRL